MKRSNDCTGTQHVEVYAPPAKRAYLSDGKDFVTASVNLPFTVYKWSSYHPGFHPRNICENSPVDARWMARTNVPPQFVILKLEHAAIVESVSFNNPNVSHVCQLRLAKVFGGLREDQFVELGNLHLSKDETCNNFPLLAGCNKSAQSLQRCVPCMFFKIVPLESYDNKFNLSIWNVELYGYTSPSIVTPACSRLNKYLEDESMRLCMKFLREKCHIDVVQQLMDRTGTCFEDAWLTNFHQHLVEMKDFKVAEVLVKKAAEDGLFDRCCSQTVGVLKWTQIKPVTTRGESTKDDLCWPVGRGGHDMCVDPEQGFIYLFGGWDGRTDLGDLWRFSTRTGSWECLSVNTEDDGGPTARSCHQICIDTEKQQLYVLGRYYSMFNKDLADQVNSAGNFFRYDIAEHAWTELPCEGVPTCIYDHRMCFDGSRNRIFVFGGRRRQSSTRAVNAQAEYSGLYSYDVCTGEWTSLRSGSCGRTNLLCGRISHAMSLAPNAEGNNQLLVFGGHRNGLPLPFSSMECYDPESDSAERLPNTTGDECHSEEPLMKGVLTSGTLQSVYDPERREIRVCPSVFGGEMLTATPPSSKQDSCMQNFLWSFSLDDLRWTWLKDVQDPGPRAVTGGGWPLTRTLHCFVYDPSSKAHYVFGGCEYHQHGKDRLDDLWKLTIERPTRDDLLRQTIFELRKLHCLHLAVIDLPAAIRYLQNDVASFISKEDGEEREELHRLCNKVFQLAHDSRSGVDQDDATTPGSLYSLRSSLFQTISSYFPKESAAPRNSLKDIVVIDKEALYKLDPAD